MKLYYHMTDGGAEYLCSRAVRGTKEGSFNSKYIIRIDGNIKKEARSHLKGWYPPRNYKIKTIKRPSKFSFGEYEIVK